MAQVLARLQLIQVVEEPAMVGRLWDVSTNGGCIAVPGAHRVQLPARGQLYLHDPMSHERHLLEVDLRWSTALSHTTFIGVLFVGGPRPAQTFLAGYMGQTWTESVPRSRLQI